MLSLQSILADFSTKLSNTLAHILTATQSVAPEIIEGAQSKNYFVIFILVLPSNFCCFSILRLILNYNNLLQLQGSHNEE